MTFAEVAAIAKDLGIAVLVIFLFYRNIELRSKESAADATIIQSLVGRDGLIQSVIKGIGELTSKISADTEAQNDINQNMLLAVTSLTEQVSNLGRNVADMTDGERKRREVHLENQGHILATQHAVEDQTKSFQTFSELTAGILNSVRTDLAGIAKSIVGVEQKQAAIEKRMSDPKACAEIRDALKECSAHMSDLLSRLPDPDPPTEPNDVPPTPNSKTTHADGAATKAALDFPDDHNQEPLAS